MQGMDISFYPNNLYPFIVDFEECKHWQYNIFQWKNWKKKRSLSGWVTQWLHNACVIYRKYAQWEAYPYCRGIFAVLCYNIVHYVHSFNSFNIIIYSTIVQGVDRMEVDTFSSMKFT